MGTQIRSRMGATPILAQQVQPDEPNRSHLGREVREREKKKQKMALLARKPNRKKKKKRRVSRYRRRNTSASYLRGENTHAHIPVSFPVYARLQVSLYMCISAISASSPQSYTLFFECIHKIIGSSAARGSQTFTNSSVTSSQSRLRRR